MEREIKENTRRNDELYRAMFGDETLGEIGDHQMIKEMHTLLIEGNTIKRFTIWFFGTTVAIVSAVVLFFQLIKNLGSKD